MSRLFPFVLVFLVGSGCHRSSEEPRTTSTPSDAALEEVPGPKDSVVFKFIRLVPSTLTGKAGEFRITKHFSKEVTNVQGTIKYLDKNEKDLGQSGLSIQEPLGPNQTITSELGFDVPENTTNIEIEVEKVQFGDGTKWKRPRTLLK